MGNGSMTGCVGWGWMAGMMIVNLLVGATFVALLAFGIIAAIGWLRRSSREGAPEEKALAILRERYARGEINREEFEARRRDLSTR